MSVSFNRNICGTNIADLNLKEIFTNLEYEYREKTTEKKDTVLTNTKLVTAGEILTKSILIQKLFQDYASKIDCVTKEDIENIITNFIIKDLKYKNNIEMYINKFKEIMDNKNIREVKFSLESNYLENNILLLALYFILSKINGFDINFSKVTINLVRE